MRFNLQTGTTELFFSDDSISSGSITWDPTQSWLFLSSYLTEGDRIGGHLRFIIDAFSTSTKRIMHRFPDQDTSQVIGYVHYANPFRIIEDPSHPLGKVQSFTRWSWPYLREGRRVLDGIIYNPMKNVFYVTYSTDFLRSDYTSWDSIFIFQKTVVYDASTFQVLDTLSVSPGWITSLGSVSDDGNSLYVENWAYQQPKAIGKYSILTKQLVKSLNVGELLVPKERKLIEDSKKGFFLFLYIYPGNDLVNKKYAIYDIDRDSVYAIIPFSLVSHGHITSNGKYIIIEETPLRPDYKTSSDEFFHPGRISIFNGITGQLIKKLVLPPDGKVLVFDNYPNMLYYYLPGEQRSINIDLSKLSIITSITSLSPSSEFAGTCPFTLTVKGKNFTAGSTVNWNGTARATTFIADSILQANILTSDIATIDSPLVTVKTSDGTESNGIRFYVIPIPSVPVITLLSQNLALPNSQGVTLVAVGSNYDSTSSITWNGTARVTQYISPKQLRTTILDADVSTAGTATVAVEYQNCITSAPVSFSIATVPYTVLVDSLASKKHQCYNLGWLKELRVERRLDRKLDRAKHLLQMAIALPPKPPKADLLDEALRGFKEDEEECSQEYGRDILHEIPQGALEEDKLKGCTRVEQELGYKQREGKIEKLTESQRKELCQEIFYWMAKKVLESFVREVEILNRISAKGKKQYLTSDAYALLKYNAQYVIDQLPEKKKK